MNTENLESNKNIFRKIYYRPIEAAIRWSNLIEYENEILSFMEKYNTIEELNFNHFPKWMNLKFNIDRIHDAILNSELPYGKNGITTNNPSLINHPDMTVRHVDLKRWINEYYPDERPQFLFNTEEQTVHPTITVATAQALLIEREAMRSQIRAFQQQYQDLYEQCQKILNHCSYDSVSDIPTISSRSESTYLNIIGCLVNLLLNHSPSGQPYSVFKTQNAIISALIAHSGHLMGISERTLQSKFTAAKRRVLINT